MSEKFVARFIDDLTKAISAPYNVYNYLLNFKLNCLDIGLISFINFFGFYRTESLTTTTTTIFGAEIVKNVLDNKNVIYTIRFKGRKKGKRGSISLFVVIIVIGLDDIYFARFLIFFLLTFTFRFIVTAFFFIVATLTFLAIVLFIRTMFERIYITPE